MALLASAQGTECSLSIVVSLPKICRLGNIQLYYFSLTSDDACVARPTSPTSPSSAAGRYGARGAGSALVCLRCSQKPHTARTPDTRITALTSWPSADTWGGGGLFHELGKDN